MTARCSVAIALAFAAQSVLAGEMPWAKNWEAAQASAKESGKLIMLDFYTDT